MGYSHYLRNILTLVLICGFTQSIAAEPAVETTNLDSLVIVTEIVGIDEQGKSKSLYSGGSGRIYRLDNIDQAVHDLNGKSILQKGTYRQIYAVLSDSAFVMSDNRIPRPAALDEIGVKREVALSVDNIRVTKDRVIAVYRTNCHTAASL